MKRRSFLVSSAALAVSTAVATSMDFFAAAWSKPVPLPSNLEFKLVKRFQPQGFYKFFLECNQDPGDPTFKEERRCEECPATLQMVWRTVWSREMILCRASNAGRWHRITQTGL